MIVFARELFVCHCPTEVPREDPAAGEMARRMRFVQGTARDLDRLDPAHHSEGQRAELQGRLDAGEYWMIGELDGKIATYTWLHRRPRIDYPYLPGCVFEVGPDVGYGYDAWTPPELRGAGLRRRAFLEELHILRSMGIVWEASFFVKHQLEGATRSLGSVGIPVIPLWHVKFDRSQKKLSAERIGTDPTSIRPAF